MLTNNIDLLMQEITSSEQSLKAYVLQLITENEEGGLGIPLIFEFHEGTEIDGIKLKKDNILLCRAHAGSKKQEVYLDLKPSAGSSWYLRVIPFNRLKSVKIHPDYKKSSLIDDSVYCDTIIREELFKEIPLRSRKKLVFEFAEKVFIPGYDLLPSEKFTIDVGVQELSWDRSKNFKPDLLFYLKNSKKFYQSKYFPFNKCLSWRTVEMQLYHEQRQNLHNVTTRSKNNGETKTKPIEDASSGFDNTDEIRVSIRATRTKTNNSIVLSSFSAMHLEKKEGYFPLFFVFKFNKTNERTHENCLVCGTKLYSKEQTYVHVLLNGYLTTNPSAAVPEHFQFFPVGKECMNSVPPNYLFDQEQLRQANRK